MEIIHIKVTGVDSDLVSVVEVGMLNMVEELPVALQQEEPDIMVMMVLEAVVDILDLL